MLIKSLITIITISFLILQNVLSEKSNKYTKDLDIEWDILNKKAREYYHLGQYGRALIAAKKALTIAKNNMGGNHQDIIKSLNNLAMLYKAKEQYVLAETLFTRALSMQEKARGLNHPSLVTSLNNLAFLYKASGKYLLAESLFKRALAITEEVFGPKHPFVATCLSNLSNLYEVQHLNTLANPLYKRMEGIKKDILGKEVLNNEGGPLENTIRYKCATCHRFPKPDLFPKRAWPSIILKMFEIDNLGVLVNTLDPEEVIRWYVVRAPIKLAISDTTSDKINSGLKLKQGEIHLAAYEGIAGAISNIGIYNFESGTQMQCVATDMANGLVMIANLNQEEKKFRIISEIPHPARSFLVDLDMDNRLDLLVSDLGSFKPAEHNKGQAIWIRFTETGTFEKHILGDGFGRVVDVKAVDIDGDSDLDIIVGEFGHRGEGGLWLLENITVDWKKPQFKRRLLDGRGGAVHTALGDIDQDGDQDIIVLRAEHYEDVTVLFNLSQLKFDRRVVFQAPHPAWGFTGLETTDFDLDGDLDLLLTNGDGFDAGGVLQPFHGIQLLLNKGDGTFTVQPPLPFRGVHCAQAGDVDGDGDMDIVACAFHPFLSDEGRQNQNLDAVIWFEQIASFCFERHVIETLHVDFPTLELNDFDGDGDLDIATGVFKTKLSTVEWDLTQQAGKYGPVIKTWENLLVP